MPGPDGGVGLRWGVEPMCAVLSEHGVPISASTYYEWIAKQPTRRQIRDAELVEIITAAREDKKNGKFVQTLWTHRDGSQCGTSSKWPVQLLPGVDPTQRGRFNVFDGFPRSGSRASVDEFGRCCVAVR